MIVVGILTAFVLMGIALISRSVTTFFHELGHAIPSLLFTDEEVCVYVGSYGDISQSVHFKIGRLQFFLKFNLLAWNLGMCTHQSSKYFVARLLIILGGPLASLSLAATLLYLIVSQGYSDNVIAIMAIFICAALIDFFVNMIPSSRPIFMHDGSQLRNDGQQLQQLIQLQRYPDTYFKAFEHYHNKETEEAKALFQEVFDTEPQYRGMYYLLFDLLLNDKDYETALHYYKKLSNRYRLKAIDFAQLGTIHQGLNNYQEAIKYFNQALYFSFTDALLLNKRGYLYQQLGEHEKAIKDFNAAIHYQENNADAYNNRGLSKLQQADMEGSFADLQQALQINPQHAEACMNMGLYYKKQQDYALALSHLEKAKELGVQHHGIDFHIEEVRQAM